MATTQEPNGKDIIGLAYREPEGASLANTVLQALQHEGLVEAEDAVVLLRYGKGRPHVIQTRERAGEESAFLGAVAGFIAAAVVGPLSPVVGMLAGATAGGIVAKVRDIGLNNEDLRQIATKLPPNSSALLILVERRFTPLLQGAIAQNPQLAAGDCFMLTFGADADTLAAHLYSSVHELEREVRANP